MSSTAALSIPSPHVVSRAYPAGRAAGPCADAAEDGATKLLPITPPPSPFPILLPCRLGEGGDPRKGPVAVGMRLQDTFRVGPVKMEACASKVSLQVGEWEGVGRGKQRERRGWAVTRCGGEPRSEVASGRAMPWCACPSRQHAGVTMSVGMYLLPLCCLGVAPSVVHALPYPSTWRCSLRISECAARVCNSPLQGPTGGKEEGWGARAMVSYDWLPVSRGRGRGGREGAAWLSQAAATHWAVVPWTRDLGPAACCGYGGHSRTTVCSAGPAPAQHLCCPASTRTRTRGTALWARLQLGTVWPAVPTVNRVSCWWHLV